MCTVVPSARVMMFAISATAHSSCRNIWGIVPPFRCWDFSSAETWESVLFHAHYDCGCSGEAGESWNAGEAALDISPAHAQTGHQANPQDSPPRSPSSRSPGSRLSGQELMWGSGVDLGSRSYLPPLGQRGERESQAYRSYLQHPDGRILISANACQLPGL